MKYIAISVLVTLLVGCGNFAVSPGVEGKVMSLTGSPIRAVVVMEHTQLEGKSKETATDESGYFSMSGLRMWTPIPFPPVKMSAEVTISAPGYEPYSYITEGVKAEIKEIRLEAE